MIFDEKKSFSILFKLLISDKLGERPVHDVVVIDLRKKEFVDIDVRTISQLLLLLLLMLLLLLLLLLMLLQLHLKKCVKR